MTKYRAFLSYRHGVEDGAFGARLHRELERYWVPRDLVGQPRPFGPVPRRLAPIFRDRDDFHAGEGLRAQTLVALQDSDALVVVCSPRAVQSPYIAAEIEEFIKLGRGDRIIPIILSGEPKDPAQTPFPPALLADGRQVIAADARPEGDGYELAKLKVIAGLIGVKLDELRKREAQAQRRRTLAFGTAAVVFATLSVATAGLAWLAEQRRQVAEAERTRAERNFAVAKRAANGLVFDIAQGLRNVEGMQAATVAKILGTAEQSIDTMVREASEDAELLNLQHAMLDEIAQTYQTQGDTARAMDATRRSLSLMERLAERDPANTAWQRGLSVSHKKIGDVLRAQGDWPGALAAYRRTLAIFESLAARDPTNTEWQRGLYVSHFWIASSAEAQGNLNEAVAAARRAEAIAVRLTLNDPLNVLWQHDLAYSHNQIGDALRAQGDVPGALAAYRKTLGILEALATRDTANTKWQRDLSVSYNQIGDMLRAQDDVPGALVAYRKAIGIREALTARDPANTEWQRDLSVSHNQIGEMLRAQDDGPGALAAFGKSLAIRELLTARDQQNAQWLSDLAASYGNIGLVLVQLGQADEALAMFEKGRTLVAPLAERSDNVQWRGYLQSFEQEIAKLRSPLFPLARRAAAAFADRDYVQAVALQGELVAAFLTAETAADGKPGAKSASALGSLAFYAVLARDPAKALEATDQALSIQPGSVWLETNRALALMILDRKDEARALLLANRGKTIPENNKTWEAVIREDFRILRAAGITHPLMAEMEAAFILPAR